MLVWADYDLRSNRLKREMSMLGTKREPFFQFPNIPPQGISVDLSFRKFHHPLHVLLTPPYKIQSKAQDCKTISSILVVGKHGRHCKEKLNHLEFNTAKLSTYVRIRSIDGLRMSCPRQKMHMRNWIKDILQ